MRKELEVKNLRISFRTNNGTVKAVRDISFDLNKGETLCIVGESGSGKSVTAKAVMGILAGNSIVEGGQILYRGQDLLKYTEKEFDKIRGNRITMIFQDPLSSLDPIVKIGKQMTEATILNGKTNCREAGREFGRTVSRLKKEMKAAGCSEEAFLQLKEYLTLIKKAGKEKYSYTVARDYTSLAASDAAELMLALLKEDAGAVKELIGELSGKLDRIQDKNWLDEKDLCAEPFAGLFRNLKEYDGGKGEALKDSLKAFVETAGKLEEREMPDFTALAFCGGRSDVPAGTEPQTFYREQFENAFLKKLEPVREEGREICRRLEELAFACVNRVTKQIARDKAIRIMEDVGIREARKRYEQYPFEFSGGMRQRIVIAIAIAANPDILICDEPTTALDVTIQAQIMELINEIKRKRELSVIFITHDLGVVANMADRVAVMYAGKIVEYGTADDIFYRPAHPYTWALLASMPDLDTKDKLEAIPGTPPNMIYPPVGDAFAERNKYAMQIDFERQPPMFRISDTHSAATWLLHPNAPKVDPPKSVTDRIRRMQEMEEQGGQA